MAAPESTTLPDGRTLAYETYGADGGAPLVFHHGTPGSRVLGALLDDAARDRGVRVVAPSRPGYGASDPHPDGTLTTWADDCAALADALGLRTFAVVGFSGGGPHALRVAERHPDRVTGVGVVAGPVPESDDGPFAGLAGFPRVLGAFFRVGEWASRYRGDGFVVRQLTDEAVAEETARVVAEDFRTALEPGASGAVRETRLLAADWSLPEPDVGVHAWHGTGDGNVAPGPVRAAYDGRPSVSTVEVESDHLGTLLAAREDAVALAV
ncbi:MAG: alpha/beta fold hydrolase [Halobacteriaceae archaeon]